MAKMEWDTSSTRRASTRDDAPPENVDDGETEDDEENFDNNHLDEETNQMNQHDSYVATCALSILFICCYAPWNVLFLGGSVMSWSFCGHLLRYLVMFSST
jgi:hypothetical protein